MNNFSVSQPEPFSQLSTKSNEDLHHIVTEPNLQKPKFSKKRPENDIKKQKSTLGLLNSRSSESKTKTPSIHIHTVKSDLATVLPIYKYRVFFFSKSLEKVYEIFVCLQDTTTVKGAVLESIRSFNEKFIREEIPVLLKEEENCFELYLSKKNGCAKKDLPSIDSFQTLALTHIKTFTLCEKVDGCVFDLRKTSKTASTDSQEYKDGSTDQSYKSQSITIAQNSYVNGLLNVKCGGDKEQTLLEDCQKHMFCGVWKLFSRKKDNKKAVNCQS